MYVVCIVYEVYRLSLRVVPCLGAGQVKGKTGVSSCCGVCGDNDCRTVSVNGSEYETIPSELIVKAGLTAALSMQSLNVK